MISYSPDDHTESHYLLSYQQLRDDYMRYTMMSDEEFAASLLQVLHFVCITCWLKEKQTQWLLSDTGLIHEIVHLLLSQQDAGFATSTKLANVRDMFNRDCCLA